MLSFYTAVFIALVVETFAALMADVSTEMERSIFRKQSTWDWDVARAHLALMLRVALRFGLGILIAIRIVQLTG